MTVLPMCALDMVESKWSNNSKANLTANLETLRLILNGGDSYGFDDLLIEEGAMALADRMNQNLTVALEKTALIEKLGWDSINHEPRGCAKRSM